MCVLAKPEITIDHVRTACPCDVIPTQNGKLFHKPKDCRGDHGTPSPGACGDSRVEPAHLEDRHLQKRRRPAARIDLRGRHPQPARSLMTEHHPQPARMILTENPPQPASQESPDRTPSTASQD